MSEKKFPEGQQTRHNIRKEEIQEIKNTLRKYEVMLGEGTPIDSFWENFNSSRCKTAMLVISIAVVLVWGVSVLLQIPNEELTVIVMGIIGFWSGRSTKAKDARIDCGQPVDKEA